MKKMRTFFGDHKVKSKRERRTNCFRDVRGGIVRLVEAILQVGDAPHSPQWILSRQKHMRIKHFLLHDSISISRERERKKISRERKAG